MGNCCRSQSSTLVWAGDDWGSFSSDQHRRAEKQSLLAGEKSAGLSVSPSGCDGVIREVKIKMTKKELDELVRELEMQGLSLERVVARLVNGEGDYEVDHHRSWRPSLQSIPEVD